jgi:hypothetical protein
MKVVVMKVVVMKVVVMKVLSRNELQGAVPDVMQCEAHGIKKSYDVRQ